MKVSREQVIENRERILEAAAQLFRERGFDGVSVAEVMKAAGLTHGAFYGYFESKEALIREAMAQSVAAARSARSAREGTADFATAYLSKRHRDNRGGGCPIAGLGSEAARASLEVRGVLTDSIRQEIERLSAASPGSSVAARRRAGIAAYASMVGALTLARMVGDERLSEEILSATRMSLDLN